MIESCLSPPLHPLFPSRFSPFPLLAEFSVVDMEQLKSTPSPSKPRKSYSKEYLMSFASLESCKQWPQNLDLAMQRTVNNELSQEVLEWRKNATTLLSAPRTSSIKCEKIGQRKSNYKMPMVHSLGSSGLSTTYRTNKGKGTLEEGMSRSYEDVNALNHEHINLEGVVDSEDMFALTARKRIVGFSPLVGLKEESNASVQAKGSQEMKLGNLSKGRRGDYSNHRSNFPSSFESCSNYDVTQEPLTLLKMKESVDEENVPCTTVPKTLWRSLLTKNDLADNEETHVAAEHETSITKVTASRSRLSDDLWHSLSGNRLDQKYSIDPDDNEFQPLQTKGKNLIDAVVGVTEQNESHLVSDSDEASPVSNASTDLFIGSISSSDQKVDLLEALFVLEGHRVLPMPAAPTLEDIEKDIISTTTSEMFLTCQDVEQSILADTKVSTLGDGGSPTLRELSYERESNGINKAASEHILSLLQKGPSAAKHLQGLDIREAGEDAGNDESEKELFGELVSKVAISSDLSNLDGVLQRYELIAAADFEQAKKSVNNFGRDNSQQACFACAATTNFGMDNSQQACLAYGAMVDSLRTSVDRGAVETYEAQKVKPKDGSESIPKASKAEVNSCDPSQKVSGEVEFFEHSRLKLKESEATPQATESESGRLTTRKLQKEMHKVSSTVSIAEASRTTSSGAVTFGVGGAMAEQSSRSTPQRPVPGFQSPTTSFWQTMPPLALVQQQQQHWQHSAGNAVKLPQVGLLRPMSYTPTIMHPFMQTQPSTTPLVPQALQALQRLVDHQLEILNNIPGEVTPGMLHQRLSRSLYGIGPGFQQTGQQLLLAGFSPGITSSYVPFTRHA